MPTRQQEIWDWKDDGAGLGLNFFDSYICMGYVCVYVFVACCNICFKLSLLFTYSLWQVLICLTCLCMHFLNYYD